MNRTLKLVCDQSKRHTAEFTLPADKDGKVIGNFEEDGRSLRQFYTTVKTVTVRGVKLKRIRLAHGTSGGSVTFSWSK